MNRIPQRNLVTPPPLQHMTSGAAERSDSGQKHGISQLQRVTRPEEFDAEANSEAPVFLLHLPQTVILLSDVREYAAAMNATPAQPRWWFDAEKAVYPRSFTHDHPFIVLSSENDAYGIVTIRHPGRENFMTDEKTLDMKVPQGFAVACINPAYSVPAAPGGGYF